MGVKVTGQFEPAGAFSIVDGKDVSGHITGSNISGSATGTGSFGRVQATKFVGDGGSLTGISSYTVANSANNRILTSVDSTNGNAESNLVFDGTNLGIGTTSPSSYYNSPLVTYQASVNYLTIATNTNGISSILMADGTSGAQAYAAQIEYQHATDEWRFHGGGSRFMTVINSNVGIGDTSPSEKLSVTGNIKASGNISGSVTSTGSFGRVEVTSGKVLGDSTSAVSVPFSIKGGTSAAAGGLQFGAYDALFGGIWPTNVTPAASNYALVAKGTRTVLNSTTDIGLYKDDATVLLFANSTGVAIGGDSTNPTKKLDVTGTGRFTGDLTLGGNLVGDDATNISAVNDITALGNISGSSTSTGSFGMVMAGGTEIVSSPITALNNQSANRLVTIGSTTTELDGESLLTWNGSVLGLGTASPSIVGGIHVKNPASQNGVAVFESSDAYVNIALKDNNGTGYIQYQGSNNEWYFQHADLYLTSTKVSGSAISTGSFGHLRGSVITSEDGNIKYKAGTQTFQNAAGTKTMAVFNGANSVDLHYNNDKKFETTNTGVTVSGNLIATGDITAQRLIVSSSVTNMTIAEKSGSTIFGDSTDDTHLFTGSLNITGSATATSFIGDGSQLTGLTPAAITTYNNATDNRIITSVNSTTVQGESNLTFDGNQMDLSTTGHGTIHITGGTNKDANLKLQNNSRLWIWQNDGDNTLFKGAGTLHLYDGTASATRIAVNSTGLVEVPGGVSGSLTSTGSFGRVSAATFDLNSIVGNWTNAGNTVADLGTITTVDINGGTIDSTPIGLSGTSTANFSNITGSALRIGGSTSKFSLTDTTPNGTANTVFGDAQFGSTSTTNTGITLFGTGQVGIAFGDASSELSGQIRYQHSTDEFEFFTGNAERLMIDSDGINVTGHVTASGDILANGNIVGDGSTTISGINTIATAGNISGSSTSTGSFGHVFVGGNILGNSDNTTEIGSTPDNGAIKKIYMVQGGEIAFGDTTNTNFFGIAEGTNNSFGDSDTMGIYYRNGLNVYSANNVQRVKILANGNVGINDTTPSYKLDVNGTAQFVDDVTLGADISGSSTSTGSFGKLLGDASDLTNLPASYTVANSSNNRVLTSVDSTNGNAEANLVFDGNHLGIGILSPQLPLEVGLTNAEYAHFGSPLTTDGHYAGISLGYMTNGSAFNRKTAIVQQQFSDGNRRGHLHFLIDTAADNFSTAIQDSKMMIHGTTGFVGINKTATSFPYATTAPACALDVTGTIHATANISGSATSTGSFGAGYFGGNVGIGDLNPTSKLNVVGKTKLSLAGQTASDRLLGLEGHASQTGNAIEYFKSGGSVLFNVNQDGKLAVGTSATVGQSDAVFYAYGHMHIRDNYQFVWGTNINSAAIQGNASSNSIKLKVNTNHYLMWNATGLGVNTQSPTHKLHVVGTGKFTDTLTTTAINASGNVSGSSTSTGSFGRVEVEHIHSTDDMTVGDDLTVSGLTTSDTAVIGGTSITQTNTILEINKASGNHHLTMLAANNASNSLRFRNASGQEVYAGMFGDVSGGQNKFGVYATGLRFVVDQSGNVGIGNANPSEKLDVTGNIKASGNISGSSTSTGSFGRVETAGNLEPKVHNTSNLGSESRRWANIYSADLQLSNMDNDIGNEIDGTKGSWTIQEGEDDLYLLNRKNGKKYKFKLEEIT